MRNGVTKIIIFSLNWFDFGLLNRGSSSAVTAVLLLFTASVSFFFLVQSKSKLQNQPYLGQALGKMVPSDDLAPKSNFIVLAWTRAGQIYQKKLDDYTPHVAGRWIFAGLLLIGFLCRVFIAQGWYIVTYALAIYHLNLLIAFLTPRMDPSLNDFDDDRGPELPTRANEEFRPFIRRLPEFKFWYAVVKSIVCAIICTLFEFTNVPVFWPVLLMYFITLFIITMRRQIKHMIKYRYLPFTYGKPKYQGLPDSGKAPSEAEKLPEVASGSLQEV